MLIIRRILGERARNLEAKILFVNFSKTFDSIEGRLSKFYSPTAYSKKQSQP